MGKIPHLSLVQAARDSWGILFFPMSGEASTAQSITIVLLQNVGPSAATGFYKGYFPFVLELCV